MSVWTDQGKAGNAIIELTGDFACSEIRREITVWVKSCHRQDSDLFDARFHPIIGVVEIGHGGARVHKLVEQRAVGVVEGFVEDGERVFQMSKRAGTDDRR